LGLTIDCGEGKHDLCIGWGRAHYLIPQLGNERFDCGCPCHKKEGSVSEVRYPDVTVVLSGTDGNAFAIVGRVRKAMSAAGVPDEMLERYRIEAMAGDYDHLLQTTMRWVNVE